MKEYAIKVEGLKKSYLIASLQARSYETLRDTVVDKVKGIFSFNKNNGKETFNALDAMNFTIYPGDKVAIIGHNGAGKSTLLKILSRITRPSEGTVRIRGRVTSLLEVGTGFHPELTGRENIYLNGSILGMSKLDINEKFDDIVKFSGITTFLDTPVKRYSSGMRMRLGFAVAAHLDSEVLIIDEVLAVGDAEFQKKCIGKMDDISKTGERTIIFVSHQMSAVKQLCNRGIVLNKGKVQFDGDIDKSIILYKESIAESNGRLQNKHDAIEVVEVEGAGIKGAEDDLILKVKINSQQEFKECVIDYGIYNEKYFPINHYKSAPIGEYFLIKPGINMIEVLIKKSYLHTGEYQFGIYIAQKDGTVLLDILDLNAVYIDMSHAYSASDALMSFDTKVSINYE